MIEEPPVLTIRRQFPRLDAARLQAIAGLPSGFLVDAQDGRGALDHRIKPLVHDGGPMSRIAGSAITCHCGPADNLALLAAVAIAEPGDVVVAATDGFTGTCVVGDLVMGMARDRGLAGLVTDGLVRDVAGIVDVGLPVYCAGVTPNSPVSNGPGTIGQAVTVGGVSIEAGDAIVGDGDGAVVVARARLDDVIRRLADVQAAEADLDAAVAGGLGVFERIETLLASDQVRFVD